jgi:hypothetical protein
LIALVIYSAETGLIMSSDRVIEYIALPADWLNRLKESNATAMMIKSAETTFLIFNPPE